MMTKKNFEAVAAIFAAKAADYDAFADDAAGGFNEGFAAGQLQALTEVGEHLAGLFADDNPLFNKARFIEACGI